MPPRIAIATNAIARNSRLLPKKSVETSDASSYLCVRVSDEGAAGLDHEVFRRGVSGDGGTGVGLAVATELAESLGGRLDLDDGPATGFVLRLPRVLQTTAG